MSLWTLMSRQWTPLEVKVWFSYNVFSYSMASPPSCQAHSLWGNASTPTLEVDWRHKTENSNWPSKKCILKRDKSCRLLCSSFFHIYKSNILNTCSVTTRHQISQMHLTFHQGEKPNWCLETLYNPEVPSVQCFWWCLRINLSY